jgi:hypothetical protein
MLMSVFQFTEDDLQAARQGILSDGQRVKLHQHNRDSFRDTLVGLVMLALILGVCSAANGNGGFFEKVSIGLMFGGGIALYGLLLSIFSRIIQGLAVRRAKVRFIRGIAETFTRNSRTRTYTLLKIRAGSRSREFGLTDAQKRAIREGQEYNVYYLLDLHHIVAIEEVQRRVRW